MPLLAIESALTGCSVAIAKGEKILAFGKDDKLSGQAASLVPLIEKVMREAGLTFGELQKIIVTCGPGSFTGIRIGLATAQALGFASGVKVQCLTTLAAAAVRAHRKYADASRILAQLPAGKGELYTQVFEHLRAESEPALLTPEAAEALGKTCHAVAAEAPDARDVAWLAAQKEAAFLLAEPFYIRPPDAKPAKPLAARAQ